MKFFADLLSGSKNLRRHSVQLGYCALLLLAVWISYAAMASSDRTQAIRQIEHNNDQLVRAYEEHVRRSLHAVEEQMLLIKAEFERAGVTPAISAMFGRVRSNPLLLQILILDTTGKIIASVEPGQAGSSFAERSYFQAHMALDRKETFISEPIIGRITNKPTILLSRRLNGPDGRFAGIVAMGLEAAYFSEFYQAMGLGPGQLVRISGLDGIIRASWHVNETEVGRDLKESDLYRKHLPTQPNGRYISDGKALGAPRFTSYRTMGDYPLVVQVGHEVGPALAESRERRNLYLGAATAGSLLILLFTGFAIYNVRRRRWAEERWKLVVEGVEDGVWDWDAGTDRVFYSDRCKTIVGHEPGEIGDSREEWLSRCHPGDRARVLQAISDHKQGLAPFYNDTHRLRCQDGSYKWVRSRGKVIRDEAGRVVRMIGSLTDIHAEKEAAEALRLSEQALLDSREKYKALIEQSFEAVALIDPDSWLIIEVNQQFTEWFGYSLPEDAPLSRDAITDDGTAQAAYDAVLFAQGFLPVARRTFRHKNGTLLFMERSAKIINHQARRLAVVTYRNIAEQLQQEQVQRQDVAIARRIQRAQLSCPPDSEHVALDTAFRSSGDISGDLYHLEWRNDGYLLRGYLVDVTGHGLATALYTSTINVLLHEAAELDASLPEQVSWLNRQVCGRFETNTFAAAIAFEIDLQAQELRYVGAGITRFRAAMTAMNGTVTVPGLYLGIEPENQYELQTLPLTAGDCLCFLTDGTDRLLAEYTGGPLEICRQMAALPDTLPDSSEYGDDATAVCIRIKSLPQTVLGDNWPKVMKLNGFEDYRRMKGEVAKLLAEVTGKAHSVQEVAVNEAIVNALECRDGKARSQKAHLRFNRIGKRLVVRVGTSRIGFAGNAVLQRLRSHPEEMFSFGEDASMGRGVPLMLSLADCLTYNKDGTELLLAWNFDQRTGRPSSQAGSAKGPEDDAAGASAVVSRQVGEPLPGNEEKFRALFGSMTEMVVFHELVFNQQGQAVNYRILDCNQAFSDITGIAKEQAAGRLATEVYRTEAAPYLEEYSRVAAAAGGQDRFEVFFAPMGKYFSISAVHSGKNRFATISSDITQIKQAENALRASRTRYQALMEQSFEALALIDISTQEVLEVNRRFSELFGYSLPEDAPLYVNKFVMDSKEKLDYIYNVLLQQQRFIDPGTRVFRHKNGSEIFVERAGSVINIDGQDLYLASMRDMTAERRRQAEMARDVEFARRVQRELLHELPKSPYVKVRTLYHPVNFISGDSYHLAWHNEGKLLRGFLIDVSGHGLATAIQNASISVLLQEADTAKLPLLGQVKRVNSRAAKYFADGAYAAILGFELDLLQRELRYIGAGITCFYMNGRKIETPGMFVGLWENAEFTAGTLTLVEGDTLHFLTDGFTDWLAQPENQSFWSEGRQDFDADVAALQQLAENARLRDDATGVCLKIRRFG